MRLAKAPRRCSRGQIVIPALFVLPSLFLFVFLIFETAKLSREKIRHQFAVDAAAFVEMTNYSDFLNRSAYVNGAFPQRIFYEGFHDTDIPRKDNTQPRSLYDILYENGDFPRSVSEKIEQPDFDEADLWDIEFGGPGADEKNRNPPDFPQTLYLITEENALKYWLSWDDAQDIYKLYVQIYQLLGSVEDAQHSVFKRLTGTHNFFRKSYWLNTGDPINDAQEGAAYFNSYQFRPQFHCIEQMMLYGNKPTSKAFQPYQIYAPKEPVKMNKTIEGCAPEGLFQAASLPDQDLRNMRTPHALSPYPGYPVLQHWSAPDNYFKVNFNSRMENGRPRVHATISLGVTGGRVWPDPTPKFQSRLYP